MMASVYALEKKDLAYNENQIFTQEFNDALEKIIGIFINTPQRVTTILDIAAQFLRKNTADLNTHWKEYNNHEKMKLIRRVLYFIADFKMVACRSTAIDEHKRPWEFMIDGCQNEFTIAKDKIIDLLQQNISMIESSTLFMCSQQCSEKAYPLAYVIENNNLCEHGHPLVAIDKESFLDLYYNRIEYIKHLMFPDFMRAPPQPEEIVLPKISQIKEKSKIKTKTTAQSPSVCEPQIIIDSETIFAREYPELFQLRSYMQNPVATNVASTASLPQIEFIQPIIDPLREIIHTRCCNDDIDVCALTYKNTVIFATPEPEITRSPDEMELDTICSEFRTRHRGLPMTPNQLIDQALAFNTRLPYLVTKIYFSAAVERDPALIFSSCAHFLLSCDPLIRKLGGKTITYIIE